MTLGDRLIDFYNQQHTQHISQQKEEAEKKKERVRCYKKRILWFVFLNYNKSDWSHKNIGFLTKKMISDKSEHIPIGITTVAIFRAAE